VFLAGRSGGGGGEACSHCIAMAIIGPQIMLDDQAKRQDQKNLTSPRIILDEQSEHDKIG